MIVLSVNVQLYSISTQKWVYLWVLISVIKVWVCEVGAGEGGRVTLDGEVIMVFSVSFQVISVSSVTLSN